MSDSCDPMDCSLPGSSVHGILQARILEWVAISFSRGSSQPWNRTHVSCIAGRFFTDWARREALFELLPIEKFSTINIMENTSRVIISPSSCILNLGWSLASVNIWFLLPAEWGCMQEMFQVKNGLFIGKDHTPSLESLFSALFWQNKGYLTV